MYDNDVVSPQLLGHLSLIKDSKHSQVTQYIQKTLKKKSTTTAGGPSNGVVTTQTSSGESLDVPLLPPDLVSTFSEVLKKIGNHSTKRQVQCTFCCCGFNWLFAERAFLGCLL